MLYGRHSASPCSSPGTLPLAQICHTASVHGAGATCHYVDISGLINRYCSGGYFCSASHSLPLPSPPAKGSAWGIWPFPTTFPTTSSLHYWSFLHIGKFGSAEAMLIATRIMAVKLSLLTCHQISKLIESPMDWMTRRCELDLSCGLEVDYDWTISLTRQVIVCHWWKVKCSPTSVLLFLWSVKHKIFHGGNYND